MERRQNNGRRCQIVQRFVTMIMDDVERLICFLYANGYKDGTICRTLHIDSDRLALLKLKIALDLKKAGILNSED